MRVFLVIVAYIYLSFDYSVLAPLTRRNSIKFGFKKVSVYFLVTYFLLQLLLGHFSQKINKIEQLRKVI